jgi:dTDP-4-amino-4,6-dideoxygalactose transaminase
MNQQVEKFEQLIAEFYGAPYAVAVDCCTHAIELCLRLTKPKHVLCPTRTYLSVPMTFKKLDIEWDFVDYNWNNFYFIGNTNIVDAAVYWERKGYIPNTMMCLSFQHKKHLSLGRGGMILLDNLTQYNELKKMRYDGRLDDIPWKDQDIDSFGYHYYMTPETAEKGIFKFCTAEVTEPKLWSDKDYPNISEMKIFNAQQK